MPVAEHLKSDSVTNSCFQIALKPVDIPFYKLDYGFHCFGTILFVGEVDYIFLAPG